MADKRATMKFLPIGENMPAIEPTTANNNIGCHQGECKNNTMRRIVNVRKPAPEINSKMDLAFIDAPLKLEVNTLRKKANRPISEM